MNKLRLAIAFCTALLVTMPFAFAEGDHHVEKQHHLKLLIDQGDDVIDVEFADLAVGETRQFLSKEGKEVLVTRTEEGIEITVDGKKIDVLSDFEDEGHVAVNVGEGKHVVKVIKHGDGDGEESSNVFVWTDEDGEIHTGEHGGFVFIQGESVLDRLLESGVLDELDEETRQRIIDEVTKAQGTADGARIEKEIKVIVHQEKKDGAEN